MNQNTFNVIGVMSGTSLDGLDLAWVKFIRKNERWSYEMIQCTTVQYPKELLAKLTQAFSFHDTDLSNLDFELGQFIGRAIKACFSTNLDSINFIASHGHTIKHQPEVGLTLQIGSAEKIYTTTRIPVVNNFRELDVRLGGQGAPLVPIGDKMLFGGYDFCINLGGISNVSFEDSNGQRRAYDICPFNMMLNYVAQRAFQLPYDDKGGLARKGKVHPELLSNLNSIQYLNKPYPKSLGFEDFVNDYLPKLSDKQIEGGDLLRTLIEHAAVSISNSIQEKGSPKVLITGGGAYNEFFIERLQVHSPDAKLTIPTRELIDFKEALIFGFLGVLRVLGIDNTLSSVTGASIDSSGGDLCGF